jgi:hypothetical protein
MTQAEFEALLADNTKRIEEDISWQEDEDHSPGVEFRAQVDSDPGFPLFIKGWYNREAVTLSYALIHRGVGRIYGLDLGKDHHNPSCVYVGERHKHSWTELVKDKDAYVATDITVPVTDPIEVWRQFCQEANINHTGVMHSPPPRNMEMFS